MRWQYAIGCALFAFLAHDGIAIAAPAALPVTTVAAIHAQPPVAGTLVRVFGNVIDTYYCPPCPPDMTCKPCLHATSITVTDHGKPHGPSLLLSIDNGYEYLPTRKFRIDIKIDDRAQSGFDGHVESIGLP